MSASPRRLAFDGDGDGDGAGAGRSGDGAHRAVALDLPDGELSLITGFLGPVDADRLLDELVRTTPWRQETIKLYGRESPVPRLTSWHGDPGAAYTYSNIAMQPEPWSSPLLEIRG